MINIRNVYCCIVITMLHYKQINGNTVNLTTGVGDLFIK